MKNKSSIFKSFLLAVLVTSLSQCTSPEIKKEREELYHLLQDSIILLKDIEQFKKDVYASIPTADSIPEYLLLTNPCYLDMVQEREAVNEKIKEKTDTLQKKYAENYSDKISEPVREMIIENKKTSTHKDTYTCYSENSDQAFWKKPDANFQVSAGKAIETWVENRSKDYPLHTDNSIKNPFYMWLNHKKQLLMAGARNKDEKYAREWIAELTSLINERGVIINPGINRGYIDNNKIKWTVTTSKSSEGFETMKIFKNGVLIHTDTPPFDISVNKNYPSLRINFTELPNYMLCYSIPLFSTNPENAENDFAASYKGFVYVIPKKSGKVKKKEIKLPDFENNKLGIVDANLFYDQISQKVIFVYYGTGTKNRNALLYIPNNEDINVQIATSDLDFDVFEKVFERHFFLNNDALETSGYMFYSYLIPSFSLNNEANTTDWWIDILSEDGTKHKMMASGNMGKSWYEFDVNK